ncbi:hypothetical protein KAS50_05170, partial [bacterium]|nr:hypothetical protein [bacterium]
MKRLVLLFLVILFSGNSFAQDTTAVDKKAVPAPIRIKTEKEEIEEFKKSLPTIDMKEHVITGKEEMKVEPSEKKLDEDPEFVKGKKEILDESGDPIPKKPFEYSDVKHTKAIYLPSAGEGNFLQLLYGRYSEMDAVLQTGKVYNNDEVIFGGDFRRTSGFTDNAGMYNGSLWFSDFHRFTEGVTGVVNFGYAQGMHKFYGSSVFPDLERTTQFFNGGFQLHSRRWTSWDIGLEAGGRAGKVKDMEDVTETGVNGRFYVKKIAGSALVKAEVLYDGEFLDRDSENHTVDLVKGNFEIEGNIKRVFRIKVGLN